MTTLTQTPTRPKPAPAQIRRDDAARSAPPAEKPAPSPDLPPLPAWVERYKFDVLQYRAMAEAGVLKADDRVELIDGEIVAMSAAGPEHVASVNVGAELLYEGVRRRAIVSIQNPIALGDRHRPEPDIALLRRSGDFYRSEIAGADDVLLVIEVADSSLEYDLQVKLARYARFGVPEVWIANIRARTIEAYTDPVDGEYTTRRTFLHGQTVSPAAFPDVALPVSDVIGGLPDAEG